MMIQWFFCRLSRWFSNIHKYAFGKYSFIIIIIIRQRKPNPALGILPVNSYWCSTVCFPRQTIKLQSAEMSSVHSNYSLFPFGLLSSIWPFGTKWEANGHAPSHFPLCILRCVFLDVASGMNGWIDEGMGVTLRLDPASSSSAQHHSLEPGFALQHVLQPAWSCYGSWVDWQREETWGPGRGEG